MTRRELKEDELLTTFEWFQRFGKEHYRELFGMIAAGILIVGSVMGWKDYTARQEAAANMALATALSTYHAYVGAPAPGSGVTESYATVEERDKKALAQFRDVASRYRRQKAGQIALYHVGVCQSDLGDSAVAIKTLQQAARSSDNDIASLAQFARAGELIKTGQQAEGLKLYQQLADHPTLAVPRATALLAMADAQRATQPAEARKIYAQLQVEFASDATLASTLKEQIASLPQ
jgi:tetratricopeptide (TPR) repeat protein